MGENIIGGGVNLVRRFTQMARNAREVQLRLKNRRRREKIERRQTLDYLTQLRAQLLRWGYRAPSADYLGRLRLTRRTHWFLREFGYTTISELEESCLNGTGVFRERPWESGFLTRVRKEVIRALIEYRENRLRILQEYAAKG